MQLLPAGPRITGRDGRAWTMADAEAVVRATLAADPVLHIDYEHASETRAPDGEPAPAAGWIEALDARPDGIWAQVAWTERAAQMIASREYRYLSPVFYFDRQTGEILSLVSAGLTNRPNLQLAALNRGGVTQHTRLLDDAIRPLTDVIDVRGAVITPYTVDATLKIALGPDPVAIRTQAETALAAYAAGRHRVGRTVYRDGLIAAAFVAGVETVVLTSPAADVEPGQDGAAYASTITVATEVVS